MFLRTRCTQARSADDQGSDFYVRATSANNQGSDFYVRAAHADDQASDFYVRATSADHQGSDFYVRATRADDQGSDFYVRATRADDQGSDFYVRATSNRETPGQWPGRESGDTGSKARLRIGWRLVVGPAGNRATPSRTGDRARGPGRAGPGIGREAGGPAGNRATPGRRPGQISGDAWPLARPVIAATPGRAGNRARCW